jgi:hypothetical protein
LSGRDHRWFKRSTRKTRPVTRDNNNMMMMMMMMIIIIIFTILIEHQYSSVRGRITEALNAADHLRGVFGAYSPHLSNACHKWSSENLDE